MKFFESKKSKPSPTQTIPAAVPEPAAEVAAQDQVVSTEAPSRNFDDMTADALFSTLSRINDPQEFATKVQPRHIRKVALHLASANYNGKSDLLILKGIAANSRKESLQEAFMVGVIEGAVLKLESAQYESVAVLASVLKTSSTRIANEVSAHAEKLIAVKDFEKLEALFVAGIDKPELLDKVSSFIPIETAQKLFKQAHNMRGLDVLLPFHDRSMIQLTYSKMAERFKGTDIIAYQWISKILEAVDFVPERFPAPFVMEYPKPAAGQEAKPTLRMTFSEISGKLFIQSLDTDQVHIGINALKAAWRPGNKTNCDIVETGIVRVANYSNGTDDWTNGKAIPNFAKEIAQRELHGDQGVRDTRELPPRPTERKKHFLPF